MRLLEGAVLDGEPAQTGEDRLPHGLEGLPVVAQLAHHGYSPFEASATRLR